MELDIIYNEDCLIGMQSIADKSIDCIICDLPYGTTSCKLHQTQKPVELLEWLVKIYSNEGDVVLNNCIGSGTTAIACMNTDRHYIGFELDKSYYDKCIERISAHES